MKSNWSGLTRRLQRVLAPVSKAEERRAVKSAIAYFINARNTDDVRYRALGATLHVENPPHPAAVPPCLIDVFEIFREQPDRGDHARHAAARRSAAQQANNRR